MSFSADWLALREPLDHASVNIGLREALRAHFAGRDSLRVVDLGCGAGSNLRGTWTALPRHQHWTLVDYDQRLLEAARARNAVHAFAGEVEIAYRQADFSSGDFAPLITGADLVTAAALFDLVSVPVLEKLADAVVAAKQAFYTVLSYDGLAAFFPEHAADAVMRAAFNAHQRGDKGFGPAAGPDATEALSAAFSARGYRVSRARSPWVIDQRYGELRRQLDDGWASAVAETGLVDASLLADWRRHRREAAGAVSIVGHEDVLALPAG